MLIAMILLLGLFIIAAFIVVYVIINNKELKDKVKEETKKANTIKRGKNESESRLVKIYDKRIETLIREATRVDKNITEFKDIATNRISHLEKENEELKKLVKQLKSVSISERAFLIDLEE